MLPPTASLEGTHSLDTLVLFDRDEIQVGKQLGKGGFSSVYEIKSFRAESTSDDGSKSWKTHNQTIIRSFYRANATDEHSGKSNYVMKHLRHSLMTTPKSFQMAAVDLAVEAHFLASFRHPNIVRLRGLAADGVEGYRSGRHDGYFLIFDRLEETLEQRMESWRRREEDNDEPLSAIMERVKLHQMGNHDYHKGDYSEPVKFATQIASALSYLHERDIIYRDIKPSNCGIDAHGDIKLFDFGFSRELPKTVVRDVDDTFKMTGRIGTLRYMSPEVALEKEYNLKADVYSWSVLFWEMLSCEMPYRSLPRDKFLTKVCKQGKRHRLQPCWPKPIRDVIEQSWSDQISTRPSMDQVYSILERIDLEQKENVSPQRQRSRSVVLELPPSFDIEKREPANGTVSTSTSMSRESISITMTPARS